MSTKYCIVYNKKQTFHDLNKINFISFARACFRKYSSYGPKVIQLITLKKNTFLKSEMSVGFHFYMDVLYITHVVI